MRSVTFNGQTAQPRIRVAFYVRVSTDGQTVDNQLSALREAAERHRWEVVATYIDHGISGTKSRDERPAFNDLIKSVILRECDMVAAWSIDRLGRSLQHLISFLSDLQAKNVDLFLIRQGLDTTTPSGRAMFQMLGVFSEFEAAMIKDRVRAGLARVRKYGTKSGRPVGRPRIDLAKERQVRRALKQGAGILKVAREMGVGTGTVSRIAADMRVRPGT